ncbi:MAG: Gfo/Idh/MocA family oxidoreductase [Planctomycetes bacterium]|nr:Gfo/Idh/MocA family oxidoreductase [Planctomycetota bacterium]
MTSRRDFLKTAAAAGAAVTTPFWFSLETARANAFQSPNERPVLGCIGTGSRWDAVGPNAMQFADCVAVCDVDRRHVEKAADRVKAIQDAKGQAKEVALEDDYRKVLERDDVDIVTIVTPDHWHTKIAIEAMQAGKDVYCEKPLTLTIEEGKQILKVLEETGRVFQVGTQQRSEYGLMFLKAVAIAHSGRLGDLKTLECGIGGAPDSGPIPKADPPAELDWEKWLGQAPLVDFRYKPGGEWGNSRCHYEFRWWYEYSGGKMTDWGAHHVDIAQWAIQQNGPGQGPTRIEPVLAEHPTPLENGVPTQDDRYNTATKFEVKVTFPGDVTVWIKSHARNGILMEGTKGRIFVGRGDLTGSPVEELEKNPLPEDALTKLYKGKKPVGGNAHMRNFLECVADRTQPVSDVLTHHRAMTTCHLANIAIRLGRPLEWDAEKEQIVGDKEAHLWQAREQRQGYETSAV